MEKYVVFNAEQKVAFLTNVQISEEENKSSEIYAWVKNYLPSVYLEINYKRGLVAGWDWVEEKSVIKWGGYSIITLP